MAKRQRTDYFALSTSQPLPTTPSDPLRARYECTPPHHWHTHTLTSVAIVRHCLPYAGMVLASRLVKDTHPERHLDFTFQHLPGCPHHPHEKHSRTESARCVTRSCNAILIARHTHTHMHTWERSPFQATFSLFCHCGSQCAVSWVQTCCASRCRLCRMERERESGRT